MKSRFVSCVLRNRSIAAAVGAGFSARVAWAIWATIDPGNQLNDAHFYARMAERFASMSTPVLGGIHTAFFPPGYSLAISPIVWVGQQSGLWGTYAAGSMFNVAAGTASILLAAIIARRWFDETASVAAAWLLALSPGHIFYTSANLSETLFTTLVLLVLVASDAAFRPRVPGEGSLSTSAFPDTHGPGRRLLGLGAIVGFAVLTKSSGLILLAIPALTARTFAGRWTGAVRYSGWALAGAVLLTAPWTIRNGAQVGVWSPLSTNNAAFACNGNRDGATGTWDTARAAELACFRGSPFDNPEVFAELPNPPKEQWGTPDEPRWYRETTAEAIGWIATHPIDELELLPKKALATVGGAEESIHAGRNLTLRSIGSEFTTSLLTVLAQFWHFGVIAMAAATLAFDPLSRRAVPVWACALGLMVFVLGGIGLPRYHHPLTALLAVFAGAAIAAISRRPSPQPAGVEEA